MATARRISTRGALAALIVPIVLIVSMALASESTAQASSRGNGCVGAFGWPVRPFDRPHPIRGGFGDPRTVFDLPVSDGAALAGDGSFSFHQGLDISAPDGSAVYAVASGTVTRARGGRVTVDCGNGRAFQYWHVDPVARVGQPAFAGKTLLGFIQPKREHVHLTQLERGRAVNPLAQNRLTPYRDPTTPRVLSVSIEWHEQRMVLQAEAMDMPSLSVPGRWHGFPITPAFVTWRIEDTSGHVVVKPRIARDVRRTVPRNDRFWETFARGAYQNWPVFDGRKQRGMTGRYFFRLSTRPFEAGTLRSARYVLVVTASDMAGNSSCRKLTFAVDGG